jgi:integrase
MSKAWVFQDHRQKQGLGSDKCPWSVGWIDPDGKRKSKRIGAKSLAEKAAGKLEGQLEAGTYQGTGRKTWVAFRAEYEAKILPRLAVKTQRVVTATLDHFQRLAKPGKKRWSEVSSATVNRELRHLKAALRVAHDWGYLPVVPKFRKVRETQEIGAVVTPEHFEAIFNACDVATMPRGLPCEPGEWWRALLLFALTTGWRIEEILSLRRDDLDLGTGAILTRAADNKGGRDDRDFLPPAVLAHVKRVVGFSPLVFYWPHNERTLWAEFGRVQEAAGIHLPCPHAADHECSPACHLYGFHALRRGYATLNADTMPAPVLQRKMRHRSFTTTLRYIGVADKMKASAERVYVPEFIQERKAN